MRLSKTLASVVCRACSHSQLTGSRTSYGLAQVQRRSIQTVKWNLPVKKKDEASTAEAEKKAK